MGSERGRSCINRIGPTSYVKMEVERPLIAKRKRSQWKTEERRTLIVEMDSDD
jgi:hypothetical protein